MHIILGVLLAVVAMLGGADALAALPTEIGTELDTLKADATTLIGLVIVVVLAVVGGFKIVQLARRGVNKI